MKSIIIKNEERIVVAALVHSSVPMDADGSDGSDGTAVFKQRAPPVALGAALSAFTWNYGNGGKKTAPLQCNPATMAPNPVKSRQIWAQPKFHRIPHRNVSNWTESFIGRNQWRPIFATAQLGNDDLAAFHFQSIVINVINVNQRPAVQSDSNSGSTDSLVSETGKGGGGT